MTLLGILFVLGVAFLGTMNFEASMIAAETTRSRGQDGIKSVADSVGSILRDGVMFSGTTPFGGGALSSNSFAELPGVQNLSSPIEPYRFDNGTPTNLSDDLVLFPYFTDLEAMKSLKSTPPTYPGLVAIKAVDFDGDPTNDLFPGIAVDLDGDGILETIADADGDGISDSVQVEASVLNLSASQMAELSARLNPVSNPNGKVYVGMRVIPHTGLVNLNQSHPYLLRDTLGLPTWPAAGDPPDPNLGNFVHSPTQSQTLYAPSQDEAVLRHRGMLLPRQMTPSRLLGDPSLLQSANPTGLADMQWQLFDPKNAANDEYWSVFERIGRDPRRYWNYRPDEFWADNPDNPPTWAVRMEPTSTAIVDPSGVEYDRRHLVTTISHDDLLTRGGQVPILVTVPLPPTTPPTAPITVTDDILAQMREANLSAWDPTNPSAIPRVRPRVTSYPFEYADYPQTIVNPPNSEGNPCLVSDPSCKTNPRKGRLQLSLAWLDSVFSDDGNDTNDQLPKVARDRLIYDAFMMLVSNVVGKPWESRKDCLIDEPNPANPAIPNCGVGGRCTTLPGLAFGKCADAPRYWEDLACNVDADCLPGPFTCNPATDRCVDPVTGLRRPQALLTRTAAALTANMLDFADLECLGGARDGQGCRFDADCGGAPGSCQDRGIPTRVALRSFDFAQHVCMTTRGQELIAPVRECAPFPPAAAVCPNIAPIPPIPGVPDVQFTCVPASKVVGREFDTNAAQDQDSPPLLTDNYDPIYVYGIEKQPFITEVASHAADGTPPDAVVDARAIELYNPYDRDFVPPGEQFWIVEHDGTTVQNRVAIAGPIVSGANPFTILVWAPTAPARDALLGIPPRASVVDVGLQFQPGWTIYLVKQVLYPGDTVPTDIVVDQFTIPGLAAVPPSDVGRDNPPVAAPCAPGADQCRFSLERVVADTPNGHWTGLVPFAGPRDRPDESLGTWNVFPDNSVHPVELRIPNLGTFTKPFQNPFLPSELWVAFPTTGSMLVLPRHANRSLSDSLPPYLVTDLAFTARLNDTTNIPTVAGSLPLHEREHIDNGRMPVFDTPTLSGGAAPRYHAAHHNVAPPPTAAVPGVPGDLDELPWGQLVFDYFTVLPLNNPGPYLVDLNVANPGAPDSQPRVDLEGLRVHGRINVNAAPATVLAGLPFVPMQKVPVVFRDRVHDAVIGVGVTFPDTDAWTLGFGLADAIVAYRELRPIGGTGNYATGLPLSPPPGNLAYGRGLTMPAPLARRGSGIMSVGELANIRHMGATVLPGFRFDAGWVDDVAGNNNTQNFIAAIATLYALGDWVTVRSQVFTVYGVLRGENDPSVGSGLATQAQMQAQDVDSRAIRFQETIDRLPTVLGEPLPTRIGQRSVGRYTDVRND